MDAAVGQWHLVVVTMEASGRGRLYVDSTSWTPFSTTLRPVLGGTFTLGADMMEAGMGDWLAGLVDEVMVYGEALLPAEVASFMTAPNFAVNLDGRNVLAYYQFNNDSGSQAQVTLPLVHQLERDLQFLPFQR